MSSGPVKADTVGPMKWVRAGAVTLVMVGALMSGGVAAAQGQDDNGPTINPVAQAESDVDTANDVDFDKNQAGIDRARRTLIAIAALMTVLLIAYWWHTIPSRRLRVATKRLADQRATIRHVDADAAPIDPNPASADPNTGSADPNTGSTDPTHTSIDQG